MEKLSPQNEEDHRSQSNEHQQEKGINRGILRNSTSSPLSSHGARHVKDTRVLGTGQPVTFFDSIVQDSTMSIGVRPLILFSVLVPVLIQARFWKNFVLLDDVMYQVALGVAVVVCPRHPLALERRLMNDYNSSTWDHFCVDDYP